MDPNQKLELLNTIAGKPSPTGPSPQEIQVEFQNTKAREKAESLNYLTNDVRYKTIVEDILPTMDDVEARWELQEKYHPTGNLESETLDNINIDLASKGTKQEEYFYFQDNFSNWPKKIQDRYRQRATDTIEYNPKQDLQDSIINMTKNTRAIVSESLQNMKLGGNQSLSALVSDFQTAIEYGYNQGISTNDEGQLVVIKEGETIPIGSLPPEQNPSSELEKQIMRAYIRDAIQEEVKPYWQHARNELRDTIRLKDKTLFNKLGTEEGKDLNKFALQIIATAAEHDMDQMKTAQAGIKKILESEIHKYKTPFEYFAGYIQKIDEMQTLLEKRNYHG